MTNTNKQTPRPILSELLLLAAREPHYNLQWRLGRSVWLEACRESGVLIHGNVGAATLYGLPVTFDDSDPHAMALEPRSATGATQRLNGCRECGQPLPDGASFCIWCGAPS